MGASSMIIESRKGNVTISYLGIQTGLGRKL